MPPSPPPPPLPPPQVNNDLLAFIVCVFAILGTFSCIASNFRFIIESTPHYLVARAIRR